MYGLTKADVLIFGVAANVVAAIGAVAAGVFDDRLGPKRVILVSLVGLIASGIVLVFLSGQRAFWIFGLALCQFVGPAQSASRSFLIRVAPVGHEGQMFGLYTTTGRVVSFLAPMLFSLFAKLWGSEVRHHQHRAYPRARAGRPTARSQSAGPGRRAAAVALGRSMIRRSVTRRDAPASNRQGPVGSVCHPRSAVA